MEGASARVMCPGIKGGNSTRGDLPPPGSVYSEGMSCLPGLYNETPTYHSRDCTFACFVQCILGVPVLKIM